MALFAGRLVAMLLQPFSNRFRSFGGLFSQIASDIWRRRRRRRANDLVEHPRAAQHRRSAVAIRGPHQYRRLAQQAEAIRVRQGDFFKRGGVRSLNSVVTGQCVIDERLIGGQQIHDILVP